MIQKFIINGELGSAKTVEASHYVHQDGLWTFLDGFNKQVYSIAAPRVVTIERVEEPEQ